MDIAGSTSPATTARIPLAGRVAGTLKWFNVKECFGFINRTDTGEDSFHSSHCYIVHTNRQKTKWSVGEGEAVEFVVLPGKKDVQTAKVTGPYEAPVKGSVRSQHTPL